MAPLWTLCRLLLKIYLPCRTCIICSVNDKVLLVLSTPTFSVLLVFQINTNEFCNFVFYVWDRFWVFHSVFCTVLLTIYPRYICSYIVTGSGLWWTTEPHGCGNSDYEIFKYLILCTIYCVMFKNRSWTSRCNKWPLIDSDNQPWPI